MANNKTDYLENALINHVLRNTAMTSPTTVYVSLHSATTTEAGGGAELSGNGYTRVSVAFSAPSNGATSNSADVLFPVATGSNWAAATDFALWDASSAGNMLYYGVLTASQTILVGQQGKFAAGSIAVSET